MASALSLQDQLNKQLLQVQGDTDALRRLEIDALKEVEGWQEAGLVTTQRQIWALEDYQAAQKEAERLQKERTRDIERETQAWARAREQLASFGVSISNYIANLRGTDAGLGSPADQLAASSQAFYEQYNLAASGDRNAMNNITQYADRFIEAQKGWSASGSQTTATIDKVAGMLSKLPEQLSAEQFLSEEFRGIVAEQTEALNDIFGNGFSDAITSLSSNFARIDANLNGLLTFDEIKRALGDKATDAQVAVLIAAVDTNGDGMISKQELTNARLGGLSRGIANAVAGEFDRIDISADGLIDYNEFRNVFAGMATDSELRRIFNQLDATRTGTISRLDAQTNELVTAAKSTDLSEQEQSIVRALNAQQNSDTVRWWGWNFANEFQRKFSPSVGEGIGVSLAPAQNGYGARSIATAFKQILGANSVNGSHATGLGYVPFDGYIAELHKGELVATADNAKVLRELAAGAPMSAPPMPAPRGLPMPTLPAFPLLDQSDQTQLMRDVLNENKQLRADIKKLMRESNKHLAAANNQRGAAAKGQISAIERGNKMLKKLEDAQRLEAAKR